MAAGSLPGADAIDVCSPNYVPPGDPAIGSSSIGLICNGRFLIGLLIAVVTGIVFEWVQGPGYGNLREACVLKEKTEVEEG